MHTKSVRSNRLRQEPAIDTNIAAGDETAGFGTGEKDRRANQFVGFAKTSHGRVTQDGLGAGSGRAVGIEEELTILFGGKEPGRNGVNSDAFGGPFTREQLRQVDYSGFGCRIGDDT